MFSQYIFTSAKAYIDIFFKKPQTEIWTVILFEILLLIFMLRTQKCS